MIKLDVDKWCDNCTLFIPQIKTEYEEVFCEDPYEQLYVHNTFISCMHRVSCGKRHELMAKYFNA